MRAWFVVHQGKIEKEKLVWNRRMIDANQVETYEDHLIRVAGPETVHVKETFDQITNLIGDANRANVMEG